MDQTEKKKIVIGTDHGGVDLKNHLRNYLESIGYEVMDMGVSDKESVDYPDTSERTCIEYKKGGYKLGIVLCGTGIGASIAANKVPGIRCALVHDLYTAEMARAHNKANVVAFGGRITYAVPPERLLDHFFETDFLEGRHKRRIDKISKLEERYPSL